MIRVWFEPDAGAHGFRARITATSDVLADREDSHVVRTPDAVVAAVQAWLGSIAGPATGEL